MSLKVEKNTDRKFLTVWRDTKFTVTSQSEMKYYCLISPKKKYARPNLFLYEIIMSLLHKRNTFVLQSFYLF